MTKLQSSDKEGDMFLFCKIDISVKFPSKVFKLFIDVFVSFFQVWTWTIVVLLLVWRLFLLGLLSCIFNLKIRLIWIISGKKTVFISFFIHYEIFCWANILWFETNVTWCAHPLLTFENELNCEVCVPWPPIL